MARRPPGLKIDTEVAKPERYSLTRSGTYQSDEFKINSLGIRGNVSRASVPGLHIESLSELSKPVEDLGQGASGSVHKVIHNPSNRFLAIKKINVFDEPKREQILTELRAYCDVQCPSIVEYFGAFFNDGVISIALELMDCSLMDLLQVMKSVPEPILCHYARQMLIGLEYLKRRHIVHRDIKPSNLLINSLGQVKVSDFGTSAMLVDTKAAAMTFVGTMVYMSPERLRGDQYSYGADLWSFGMCILQLATGSLPFSSEAFFFEVLSTVKNPGFNPAQYMVNGSEYMKDLVTKCLDMDVSKRPDVDTLLNHPWFVASCATDEEVVAWSREAVRMVKQSRTEKRGKVDRDRLINDFDESLF